MTDEGINIEQLMLEKLAGIISEDDDLLLGTLMRENEAYKRRYEALEDIYQKNDLGKLFDRRRTEKAWTNVRAHITEKIRSRKIWLGARIAAVVAVPILFLAAGWYLFSGTKQPQKATAQHKVLLHLGSGRSIVLNDAADSTERNIDNNVRLNLKKACLSYSVKDKRADDRPNLLEVPVTQTYQLVLSDGTNVWLNSASSLKFPFVFGSGKREVFLTGEAYFKVAKDARHPFIVHTAYTAIQDLGTAFDVNAYDAAAIKTSLVEGLVITSAKDGSSEKLVPGQQAVFNPDTGFQVTSFDRDSLLSWRQGIYYFDNTPLQRISPIIYRWFGKSLKFQDTKVASYAFSGALFKNKSLREFLDNLSFTSNIGYQLEEDAVYLTAKKQ